MNQKKTKPIFVGLIGLSILMLVLLFILKKKVEDMAKIAPQKNEQTKVEENRALKSVGESNDSSFQQDGKVENASNTEDDDKSVIRVPKGGVVNPMKLEIDDPRVLDFDGDGLVNLDEFTRYASAEVEKAYTNKRLQAGDNIEDIMQSFEDSRSDLEFGLSGVWEDTLRYDQNKDGIMSIEELGIMDEAQKNQ